MSVVVRWTLGPHSKSSARRTNINFFPLSFYDTRDRPNRKGGPARRLMNSLLRQRFIPSFLPRAINRPISLLPSIICLAQMYEYYNKKENAPQHSCKGNTPANAWSVVPPIWQAAAPVLAVIKVLWGGNSVIKRFKRYDLPVPALPVKNTLFPALMAFTTAICSGIRFIWKELKELRRFLAAPLCSSFPKLESLSLPVVLIRFGVTPFLSSSGLFL